MTSRNHALANGLLALLVGALGAACAPTPFCELGFCRDSRSADGTDDDDAGAEGGAAAADAPSCTVFGQAHIGLGGEDLAAKDDGPPGGDRARKGPTFGIAADRWYLEPIASAVFVNAAFEVAFEGCLKMTGELAGGSGDPRYAVAPTKDAAGVECAAWTRRFWSRAGTPDTIDACVSVATDTTSETYGRPSIDETTRAINPRRRWAYACASVLTATGFLTY
jgi:hypothetical protein